MATAVRALVAEDRQLEFPPDVHGGVDRAATKNRVRAGVRRSGPNRTMLRARRSGPEFDAARGWRKLVYGLFCFYMTRV